MTVSDDATMTPRRIELLVVDTPQGPIVLAMATCRCMITPYVGSVGRAFGTAPTGEKTRRSACQSKEAALHDAQIDFMTRIYNFADENRSFRQCINPNAKRFEVKYKKYSPAMLEDFTDHCLTLEELLMWRVPQ